MGRISKGIKCSVEGCDLSAVKSVAIARILELNLNFKVSGSRGRAYLCREHYKEFKKADKKLKRLEKKRWT